MELARRRWVLSEPDHRPLPAAKTCPQAARRHRQAGQTRKHQGFFSGQWTGGNSPRETSLQV
eukprot:3960026-Alexandrium_andersonii.AAC.1